VTSPIQHMVNSGYELCLADGLEEAFVGVVERYGQEPIACYDQEKVLSILQGQGMTREGALEYFEFNTAGAWVGDLTPCWLVKAPEKP